MSTAGPLTLEDIADQRAYERERDEFRSKVIAAKRLRRVSIGPVVTLVFENRLTIRFQVQEMARAEKMVTDQQIQHELDVYNRLLPTAGELSATLFIELTSEEDLRTWLPRLVGVERSCEIRIGSGDEPLSIIHSLPESSHEANLTREETTSAVHYVRFSFTDEQVAAFAVGPAFLSVDHPEYAQGLPGIDLTDAVRAELVGDLRGGKGTDS
jgi:Protein of unknown function (DUF3501)